MSDMSFMASDEFMRLYRDCTAIRNPHYAGYDLLLFPTPAFERRGRSQSHKRKLRKQLEKHYESMGYDSLWLPKLRASA